MRDATNNMKVLPAILPGSYQGGTQGLLIDCAGFESLSFAIVAAPGPDYFVDLSVWHFNDPVRAYQPPLDPNSPTLEQDYARYEAFRDKVRGEREVAVRVDDSGIACRGALVRRTDPLITGDGYRLADRLTHDGKAQFSLSTGAAAAIGMLDYLGGQDGKKRYVYLSLDNYGWSHPVKLMATAILRRPLW
jgi:hypothetical protein